MLGSAWLTDDSHDGLPIMATAMKGRLAAHNNKREKFKVRPGSVRGGRSHVAER
jgi:hypothetical protein